MASQIQKITPNLWFSTEAEEAATYYTSIFKNSKLGKVTRFGKVRHEIPGIAEGMVMTIEFELEGQKFVALNGGPAFTFTEAISFIVHCDSQEELNHYWEKLSEGGDEKAQVCGWLKDKFGVSWQIIPDELYTLMNDPDPEKSGRVMQAMLQMKKIDIPTLRQAYEG